MNFRDWSGVIGTWVSICGALLGGYLALDAYNRDIEVRRQEASKRADARIVQTFDLFEQFQGGEMMRIRNRLSGLLQQNSNLTSEQDFFAFIDFFDAVQVCVDRQLCDAPLADQLFGPYAKGTFPFVAPQIDLMRLNECRMGITDGQRPAGGGIERFATGYRSTFVCPAPSP